MENTLYFKCISNYIPFRRQWLWCVLRGVCSCTCIHTKLSGSSACSYTKNTLVTGNHHSHLENVCTCFLNCFVLTTTTETERWKILSQAILHQGRVRMTDSDETRKLEVLLVVSHLEQSKALGVWWPAAAKKCKRWNYGKPKRGRNLCIFETLVSFIHDKICKSIQVPSV